jgi:dihydroorotate dehydrogenase
MPKFDLEFKSPLINAAGSLGFYPDLRSPIDFSSMGAFVTNPISLRPRKPAGGVRYLSYPGGFLMHTGYPNLGLSAVLRRFARRWENSPLPVLVNCLCQDINDTYEMVSRLEGLPGVMGVELSLPPHVSTDMACNMVDAATGEIPVIVRVPLERAGELSGDLGARTTLTAISLGPPRGSLVASHTGIVNGRLFGPSLFPMVLNTLQTIVEYGYPVIAAGGIYNHQQVDVMLANGAFAVQLDAVLWRGGYL